jgi:hypothetical protein
LRDAIQTKSNEERLPPLREFVTMALYVPGRRYPVPDTIVRELVNRASDDELFDVLDELVCKWYSNGGAYSGRNWKRRRKFLFSKLPRGLRVAHNLMSLECEVYNGGFVQFFANSSGRFARETLEDCQLVGAVKKASLLRRAFAMIKDLEAAMELCTTIPDADPFTLDDDNEPESQMNRLASAYYALEKAEPMHRLVAAYIRAHPEKCTTTRNSQIIRKRRT